MTSGFRYSVAVTAEVAMSLYRQLEVKSLESSRSQEFRAARLPENLSLNRWHNVLPYDATRVRLNPPIQTNGRSTDYVNASHVAVNEADRCYILTQGPLKETVSHFWTMVHQAKSPAIIMLCRLTEGGVCKCARYWPETTSDVAKDDEAGFEIKLLSEEETSNVVVRKIELRHFPSNSTRTVTQYHYNKWPDFGVPSEPFTFLQLLDKVSTENPSTKDHPNIVHCSAGIGRSGTFCLVDSCIQIMNKRQGPMTRQEILDVLLSMRGCRGGLVQTPEQLRFSLYALTVAMTSMTFLNGGGNDSSASQNNQVNGVKSAENGNDKSTTACDNVAVVNDEDKTSNVISVDSADDDDEDGDDDYEAGLDGYLRNGGENKSTRKRSTTEDDGMDLKSDDVDVAVVTIDERENGETQAKRSKSTSHNQDW